MASLNLKSPQSLSLSSKPSLSPQTLQSSTLPFRLSPSFPALKKALLPINSAAMGAPPAVRGVTPTIAITENAMKKIHTMRLEKNEDFCIRIGVKKGGCSGVSYSVEFEGKQSSTTTDDYVIENDGFLILCDPQSLVTLQGTQLDYNDTPFGGGFTFKNPNAARTCSCSRSFCCRYANNAPA